MERIGNLLGKQIRKVLSVDTKSKGSAWGCWLNVRVLVNILKPLILGYWINIVGGKKVWIIFKYEKLPDLCFVCGCMNHMEAE